MISAEKLGIVLNKRIGKKCFQNFIKVLFLIRAFLGKNLPKINKCPVRLLGTLE